MASPVGVKYVQGSCPCGHVGLQKRPDICGVCTRLQTRPARIYTPEQNQVRTANQRIESMVLNFKKLPKDFQLEALKRMTDLV